MSDNAAPATPPRALVGTSGFSYKEWKGTFYPAGLAEKRFLAHYATRLPAVEIDGTFYRMPSASTIERWVADTPEDFRFAVKASQKITHFERMKLPSDALAYFTRTVLGLGPRLGTVLFQLPPNLKRDDERLARFLDALPAELPRVFEFRHASWFDEVVFERLRQGRAGVCVHESDEGTTPLVATGTCAYVRLRRTQYSAETLRTWADRLLAWRQSGTDALAFVKHEENPDCPVLAEALWALVRPEPAS